MRTGKVPHSEPLAGEGSAGTGFQIALEGHGPRGVVKRYISLHMPRSKFGCVQYPPAIVTRETRLEVGGHSRIEMATTLRSENVDVSHHVTIASIASRHHPTAFAQFGVGLAQPKLA